MENSPNKLAIFGPLLGKVEFFILYYIRSFNTAFNVAILRSQICFDVNIFGFEKGFDVNILTSIGRLFFYENCRLGLQKFLNTQVVFKLVLETSSSLAEGLKISA